MNVNISDIYFYHCFSCTLGLNPSSHQTANRSDTLCLPITTLWWTLSNREFSSYSKDSQSKESVGWIPSERRSIAACYGLLMLSTFLAWWLYQWSWYDKIPVEAWMPAARVIAVLWNWCTCIAENEVNLTSLLSFGEHYFQFASFSVTNPTNLI